MKKRLCHLNDIHPPHGEQQYTSKGFDFHGQLIFAVRKQEAVFIYHNQCPHLGIQLEWLPDRFLDVDGELIQCSTHGALFNIDDGLCISGPCNGQSLQSIPYELRDGDIFIALD